MNDFYKQPILLLWTETLLLLVMGVLPAFVIIEKANAQPLFYSLLLFYVPVAQFAFTPLFRLTGVYRYYAPMLLGYMANNRQIDLHSGSSFDYLFVMRRYRAGIETRNRLLMYYLEGLISLVRQIENNDLPDTIKIVGTSYFFKDRTLQKLGFELVDPAFFYRLNLLVNVIDLTWMYSLSQRKFSVPPLWNAKKATVTGLQLLQNKQRIAELYRTLQAKTTV